MAKHPDGALAAVKLACDDLKAQNNQCAWLDLLDAYGDLKVAHQALQGCHDMLREAAKQLRATKQDGHAALCDRHADAADVAIATLITEPLPSPETTQEIGPSPMILSFTLELKVEDEAAFRRAAEARAIDDGVEPEGAAEFLNPDEKSLSDCAVMLFDPGVSPDGCAILGSGADESGDLAG